MCGTMCVYIGYFKSSVLQPAYGHCMGKPGQCATLGEQEPIILPTIFLTVIKYKQYNTKTYQTSMQIPDCH